MSENEPIFDNEDFLILLQKYEKMKSSNGMQFFDVEEFEQIIDYYLDEFQYDNAAEAAELGSKQHPASVEIKYKVVHIYLEQGMGKQSIEMLGHIPKWEHSNAEYHFLKGTALCLTGKIHDAEKSFDRGLELSSEETFEALLNIAIAFENARQYKLAVKYLEEAHMMAPQYLSAIYDLGYFNERLNKYKRSIEYYEKYLDIDPFSENVWYNLGVAYFKLNKPEKAIEAYDYSIALNPDYASAYFNKANTYASLARYDEAIEIINEFLEIEPENSQALIFLGDCYEQAERFDKALNVYKKVIEMDNTESEGWFGAAMVLYQVNNYDEASVYMLKALEFDPKNSDYWMNLGYIYEEAGKLEESAKCFKYVIRIDRTDHEAWTSLVSLLIKLKEMSKALDYLKDAYAQFQGDARICVMLAQCHFMTGNESEGLKFLQQALDKDLKMLKEFTKGFPEDQWSRSIKSLITKFKN